MIGISTYFWAVVKEVMRFRLVSPVMAPHYASQDFTLHDTQGVPHTIPQGTQLFMHGYSMALDEELWDVDPHTFYPERWLLPRNEGLDLHGKERRKNVEHYKFIPFSMGPRTCPGYSFAKVAVFLQAATIAHSFEWKLSEKAKRSEHVDTNGRLDLTENWGLTIMPQRFAKLGYIEARARPVARLARPQDQDVDYENTFLDRTRQTVSLIKREWLSPDTLQLRCSLSPGGTHNANKVLGLPVANISRNLLQIPSPLSRANGMGARTQSRARTKCRARTPPSALTKTWDISILWSRCTTAAKKNAFPMAEKSRNIFPVCRRAAPSISRAHLGLLSIREMADLRYPANRYKQAE